MTFTTEKRLSLKGPPAPRGEGDGPGIMLCGLGGLRLSVVTYSGESP